MKLYFLISVNVDGAEKLFKDLVQGYLQNNSYYSKFGRKLDIPTNQVELVIFGSDEKLQSLSASDVRNAKKQAVAGSVKNAFPAATSIKNYIESAMRYMYSEKVTYYVVSGVQDEDFWEVPFKEGVQPYFSSLVFLRPHLVDLHAMFGCGGQSCTVRCSHCKVEYKKCNPADVKQHETLLRSGMCLNNSCNASATACQRRLHTEHAKTHIPACEFCGKNGGSCIKRCFQCDTSHCSDYRYCDPCPSVAKERARRISALNCPRCFFKTCSSLHGLRDHFKHCSSVYKPAWITSCSTCGLNFLDDDHEEDHYAKVKKCRERAEEEDEEEEEEPANTHNDDLFYYVTTPANPPITQTATPVSAAAKDLLVTICSCFAVENSPVYTLSAPEITHIRSVTKALDDILRASGTVSSTVGFGSVDKGTGLPGFADIDMLVSINNFNPAKRPEYATRFRALLQAKGANLKESAHDIQQVEFEGVEFDLVLVATDASGNDKRAADFAEARSNVKDLRAIVGTNNYIKEVIRAAKYWSKRSFPAGGIKSCLIEAIVLAQYKAQKAALEALATQKKRRMRLFEIFLQFVSTHTPVASVPAAGGGELLTQLLANSPITPEQRAAAKVAAEQIAGL